MRLPYRSGKRPTLQMLNTIPIIRATSRRPLLGAVVLAALAVAPALQAQTLSAPGTSATPQPASSLPPTPPTSAPAAPPAAPQPDKPHHAGVSFEDGRLSVQADDSSLRQILSSIGRKTGMTISGGIEDQRVFGSYGPADPSTVLATLLDGTGVNMLMKEGPGHTPVELVLTPRTGGPSGPAITPQDADIGEEQPAPPPAQPAAPVTQPVVSQPVLPAPGTAGTTVPSATVQNQPVSAIPPQALPTSGTGAPPTVDSVYQQLLQLQKGKAAPAAVSPATTPASPAPPQ